MARIVYCHPSQTKYDYHIYTDLDFWDARRLLKDLAVVKRNFGKQPFGDVFPTQVVIQGSPDRNIVKTIEKRLGKAIISPPRHVIVRSMVFNGYFEFDPLEYYPRHWSPERMLRFTHRRFPLQQSSLCNAYQVVQLAWVKGKIRAERVQREKVYSPIITTDEEATRRLRVPSCF